MVDLLDTIIKGKYMMVPLMACSVFAFAVFFDRISAFWANGKVDTRALRAKLMQLMEEGRLRDAATLCSNTPSPVAAVLLVGLQSYEKHREQVQRGDLAAVMEKAMDDYSLHAMSAVEKRLHILATIGNIAPLLGMTGTVTGMIASFDNLADAGGLDPGGAVASGIAEALITTAAGLIIALFALVPYNWFTSMADKIDLEIQEARTELLDYVATH